MEPGSKLEKSTGSTLTIPTESAVASAPPKSTGEKKGSPVLSGAPSEAESNNSTGGVSASEILALKVILGDFKALKDLLVESWQASSNGKIYWCASMPGHKLALVEGKLFIDAQPVDLLLKKLLAESEK